MNNAHAAPQLPALAKTCATYPAIDNHAHNLCNPDAPSFACPPFESVFSEAQGTALLPHARSSLPAFRVLNQLATFYGCEPTWEALQKARKSVDGEARIAKLLGASNIQGVLLDDLLPGIAECGLDYKYHDRWFKAPTKRIVRLEALAEGIIDACIKRAEQAGGLMQDRVTAQHFNGALVTEAYRAAIRALIADEDVAGFKSVACYRTGLDVEPSPQWTDEAHEALWILAARNVVHNEPLRLNHKALNDWFVVSALQEIAADPRPGDYVTPIQFHTGLGDNDLALSKASPSHLQPLLKAFPTVPFVLLHSSYPYTRDAGYLASVYANAYLDFGEVFPMVARHGQEQIVRQMLEVAPTSKIVWSTDGHWYPETFYLAALQSRDVLYRVLADLVQHGDLSEPQACQVVEDLLFHNSNSLYALGWRAPE